MRYRKTNNTTGEESCDYTEGLFLQKICKCQNCSLKGPRKAELSTVPKRVRGINYNKLSTL